MPAFRDLIGQVFARLTVIQCTGRNKHGASIWLCKCLCEREVEVISQSLVNGNTQSCGCLSREVASALFFKHGRSRTGDPTYSSWKNAINRITQPSHEDYQALDIMSRNLSPEGQAAAIAQIRKTVTSQRNGRISTNPYLADMYPDPSTRQETPGRAGTQPAAPSTQVFNATKWAAAHPGQDVNAAIAQAKAQGYQVKQ
jgi:hypothetical protein